MRRKSRLDFTVSFTIFLFFVDLSLLLQDHNCIHYNTLHLLFLSFTPIHLAHVVSFKIYDLDGDGMISTKDLTKVVGDTMGEQDVVIHKGTFFELSFVL